MANQKRAYDGFLQSHGPEDPATAEAAIRLARLHDRTGDYFDAQPLYQLYLPVVEKTAGTGEDYIITLTEYGNNCKLRKDYMTAETTYQKAADLAQKELAPGHPRYLAARAGLASILSATGRRTEAAPIFLEVMEAREKTERSE